MASRTELAVSRKNFTGVEMHTMSPREQAEALDRMEHNMAITDAANLPRVWFKLKREDGRVVLGSRRYDQPGPTGVYVASVSLRNIPNSMWSDRQVTVEYLCVDGAIKTPKVCHHSQHRANVMQRAVEAFNTTR